MIHLSVYVEDEDAAVLELAGKEKGLGMSAMVRTLIREACSAAPDTIKLNARALAEQRREDADSMTMADIIGASGQVQG